MALGLVAIFREQVDPPVIDKEGFFNCGILFCQGL